MIKHLLKLIWTRKRSNTLLIVEVFFAFLVLFVVLSTVIHFVGNYRQPLGFDYEGVWVLHLGTRGRWSDADGARLHQLATDIEQFPEVRAVAGASFAPYSENDIDDVVTYGSRRADALTNTVTDGFADALGLQVTHGRWFQESDDALNWTPVVITERLARRLFGDADPVGERVSSSYTNRITGSAQDLRVVGVVDAYRWRGEYSGLRGVLFRRCRLEDGGRRLLIATRPDATAAFQRALMDRLQGATHDWEIDLEMLMQRREESNRVRLFGAQAAGVLAAFLMLMVALGLTGVLWQNVTRRTGEFGLRRAVGGTAASVRRQVLLEIILIVSLGLAVGVLAVIQVPLLGLASFLSLPVFASALAASLAIIYLMTVVAGLYPGWLATRIHPAAALHYE